MKAPEILSMIEEAAGTRMYETKKIAAEKTILKKQSKVEEINKILVMNLGFYWTEVCSGVWMRTWHV